MDKRGTFYSDLNRGKDSTIDPAYMARNYSLTSAGTNTDIEQRLTSVENSVQQNRNSIGELQTHIDNQDTNVLTLQQQDQIFLQAINGKVDAVSGKGLSTEDYTTAEKQKLASLNNYDDSLILTSLSNKVDKVNGKGLSTEDYTTLDKEKLASFGEASSYALKSEISSVYKYKGSVASSTNLPQNAEVGDVYNTESDNMNYGWDGSEWDPLGSIINVEAITNNEIEEIII